MPTTLTDGPQPKSPVATPPRCRTRLLLAGFFTRGNSELFNGEPFGIVVKPADSERRWHVPVTETLTIDPRPVKQPSLTIGGMAAAIYIGLWNRGDELTLRGEATIMARWPATQKVRWRG